MKTKIQKTKDGNVGVDLIVLCFLIIVFIALLSYYFYSKSTRNKSSSSISSNKSEKITIVPPTPTPTPRAIPHGKKKFTVGQGDHTIPQFGEGEIDPYDPASGTEQTVTIAVSHKNPVNSVTVTVQTDHATSEPHQLSRISGTAQKGQWKGSWKINDSYLYTYILTFKAVSSDSSTSVPITLR